MMPELPTKRSREGDQKAIFDQRQIKSETVPVNSAYSNNSFNGTRNYGRKWNTKPNVHSIPFNASIADRLSPREKTTKGMDNDIIPDYQASDIELMQEALSVLVGDNEVKEENMFCADSLNHSDKFAETMNIFSKKQDKFRFQFRSNRQDLQRGREKDYRIIADHADKTDGKSEVYPILLPQVTFDEEDEFNRRNFFDQHEAPLQRCEEISNISSTLPCPPIQPSDWLLRQLTMDKETTPRSCNDRSLIATTNSEKSQKGGIRASKGTKHKHWTKEEDKQLKIALELEQNKHVDWMKIAKDYFNNSRSATQCKNRWKNVSLEV